VHDRAGLAHSGRAAPHPFHKDLLHQSHRINKAATSEDRMRNSGEPREARPVPARF
jgi:hypothetical protein